MQNLAPQRLAPLRALRAELLRFPTGPVEPARTDADQAARLRSLGYLAGSAGAKAAYGPADDPKNLIAVDRQIHQAVELYERGDRAGALRVTRALVDKNPKMQLGYQHLAFSSRRRETRQGDQGPQRATANGVKYEALDRRHALLLSEEGRPRDAVAILGPHARSRDGETLNALGIALADSGRIDDALEVFGRVLAADPANVQAYQNIGITLLKGDRPGSIEKAREGLEKSIALGLRNPKAWNALGVAWMRSNAPAKALDAWQRCVEYGPEEYDALYNMGIVALKIGDLPRAKQSFEKFLASAPAARYARERAEVKKLLKDVS